MRLRLAVAKRTVAADRPFDAAEMLCWLLNGDRSQTAMPHKVSPFERLEVFSFAAQMSNCTTRLGTVLDPIEAAAQLMAWLDSKTITPIPRHYHVVVQAKLAGPSEIVRVARERTGNWVSSMPEDVLR